VHFFTFVISRLICFDFRVQSLLLLLLPSDDMGLTQKDTTSMATELAKTMTAANAAILSHGGFSTRMMIGRKPTAIDSNETDPRPPATCLKFMRQYCKPDSRLLHTPYIYEWTRKSFHDVSPIPALVQDQTSRDSS